MLTVCGCVIGTIVMGGKKCMPKTGTCDAFSEEAGGGAGPVTNVKNVTGGSSAVVNRTVTRGRCPSEADWMPLSWFEAPAGEVPFPAKLTGGFWSRDGCGVLEVVPDANCGWRLWNWRGSFSGVTCRAVSGWDRIRNTSRGI